MIINATSGYGPTGNANVILRCPHCAHDGTFDACGIQDLHIHPNFTVGIRRCPNDKCKCIVYCVFKDNKLLETYPFTRIDFDKSNIPSAIVDALEEAISCHANRCYTAAAMMIRKTLELLCHNHNTKGKNLKTKILSLKTKLLLPKELLDGVDDLRLLGNDAAHIHSKVFNDVGTKEVEIAIEFTKELLKATYQYSALVNKIKSLKKTP